MALTSPHSLSSASASFYTAQDSESAAAMPLYREARPLPRELQEHCRIFLEEQLYVCAANLLNSTLGAGLRRGEATSVPVPPASHLALLATLMVHPAQTTRAEKAEVVSVAALAGDYLRNLLAVVGPVNGGFRSAFRFGGTGGRRYGGDGEDEGGSEEEEEEDDGLHCALANQHGVWARGQDLWSTVGWAFNTAARYPARWRFWRVWLELLLDVLEADWEERSRLDGVEGDDNDEEASTTWRAQSMVVMYMDQRDGRQSGLKRIIRSLFADGGDLSSSAFPEVFDGEPRGPRKTCKKRKRELDVLNDQFGDYLDDDSISSGVSEPPTPQKARGGRSLPSAVSTYASAGLAESVPLRLRFFRRLSAATWALRRQDQLDQLYEDYAAAVKVLPLPLFSLFVSQRENPLVDETHVTITKELFELLLPAKHKSPEKVDAENDAKGALTMAMLEHCYMPWPANTVGLDDNAKLSLVVENALQLLWKLDLVEYSDGLADAAIKGIEARKTKSTTTRTGRVKAEAGDVAAQNVLNNSAERIRIFLRLLRECAGSGEEM
ncbi:hypothetical protein CDD80_7408 [Ophiocordyceps camponoti-rufipedis]|uniref:Uncharacterized protein n=1 Tax=Ophiocordyceps camponoti-rufipedis TaxID=2004952 RepID=A0A2C5YLV1_9HYPO|nr:hypothetical protein CDD80_7408 [Ophiocordyceps camponoti-rufipedis]